MEGLVRCPSFFPPPLSFPPWPSRSAEGERAQVWGRGRVRVGATVRMAADYSLMAPVYVGCVRSLGTFL